MPGREDVHGCPALVSVIPKAQAIEARLPLWQGTAPLVDRLQHLAARKSSWHRFISCWLLQAGTPGGAGEWTWSCCNPSAWSALVWSDVLCYAGAW